MHTLCVSSVNSRCLNTAPHTSHGQCVTAEPQPQPLRVSWNPEHTSSARVLGQESAGCEHLCPTHLLPLEGRVKDRSLLSQLGARGLTERSAQHS